MWNYIELKLVQSRVVDWQGNLKDQLIFCEVVGRLQLLAKNRMKETTDVFTFNVWAIHIRSPYLKIFFTRCTYINTYLCKYIFLLQFIMPKIFKSDFFKKTFFQLSWIRSTVSFINILMEYLSILKNCGNFGKIISTI